MIIIIIIIIIIDNIIPLYKRRSLRHQSPSIETYLAVVRGLPTKKFLPECVSEKSSTVRHS